MPLPSRLAGAGGFEPPHGGIKIRQFVFPQASSEFLNTQLCRYFNNFYFHLFPRLAYLTFLSGSLMVARRETCHRTSSRNAISMCSARQLCATLCGTRTCRGLESALPREASWFTSSNTASVASNAGTRSAAMGRLGHPKCPKGSAAPPWRDSKGC